MDDLERAVDRGAAETGFSGVVRIDHGDSVVLANAYGLAHRALGHANTVETQFATAGATKGLTALTIIAPVVDGALALDTTARSVLGADLPLIADDVTVEHLLAHRSGIGDCFD
jgi:CubicO group peptidase (beta-lactamase class C family)